MYNATFKIVIFGEVGTEKEELLQRFLTYLYVPRSKMTVGATFEVKSLIVDDNRVKLQIWVLSGAERFRSLLPTYIRGARGGMFVYDITKYSTLAHIDDWLTTIRKEIRAEDMFPILVVGGNVELSKYREVPAVDAIKIVKSRGLDGFIECSAKTGKNVEEAFKALAKLMLGDSEDGVRPIVSHRIRLDQVKERAIDDPNDPEIKIQRILELEKEKERDLSLSRLIKRLQEAIQPKDKIFMDQNLGEWLETLKSLKEGCEEIIEFLRDKNEQYFHHISFEQWKDFLKITSELLEEFKENPSSFYNMSDETERKLYNLFEIFIPCREILSDGSFGKNIRVSFEEYLKMLKNRSHEISDQEKSAILQNLKDIDADKLKESLSNHFPGTPFPYIFNPPGPPDDLDPVGQVQKVKIKPPEESEMHSYCKHCGAPLEDGVLVCPNCGKKI
jgi:small GTP-binding protein